MPFKIDLKFCCFCVKLHKAYVLIIYLDFLRFLWVIIISLINFLISEPSSLDCVITGMIFVTITMQTYFAFKSLTYTFFRNIYGPHKKYLSYKMSFITLNMFHLLFQNYIDSYVTHNKNHQFPSFNDPKFYVDLLWTCYDLYLALIIYKFGLRIKKVYYGPLGGVPIFPEFSRINEIPTAISIEVEGTDIDLKMFTGKDIKIYSGFPIGKKNEGVKKGDRKHYYKIFPKRKKNEKNNKNQNFCDLTRNF